MAFAYTVKGKTVMGNKRVAWGTYSNGSGDTGGDIVTGLASVDTFSLQQTGSAVTTGAPVVNETFPLASGTVTIVTDDNADGIWRAEGL